MYVNHMSSSSILTTNSTMYPSAHNRRRLDTSRLFHTVPKIYHSHTSFLLGWSLPSGPKSLPQRC
jgi:hypothetical protein